MRHPHSRTRAIVIRAGNHTTLLSLPAWFGGQLLAQVDTHTIHAATGLHRHDLPDVQLSVLARLDASTAEGLELKDWVHCPAVPAPGHANAATPSKNSGAALWAGSPANTVPITPWAA